MVKVYFKVIVVLVLLSIASFSYATGARDLIEQARDNLNQYQTLTAEQQAAFEARLRTEPNSVSTSPIPAPLD